MFPFSGNEGRKSRIILSLFSLGLRGKEGKPRSAGLSLVAKRGWQRVQKSSPFLPSAEGGRRERKKTTPRKELVLPQPVQKTWATFRDKKFLNRKNGLKNCSYICAHVEYTVWPNKIAFLISRTWSGLGSPPPCCFLPSSSFPCPTRESRQDEEKGKERWGYQNNSLFFLWPRKKFQTASVAAVKNCGTESKTLRQKYHHRWKREESPVMSKYLKYCKVGRKNRKYNPSSSASATAFPEVVRE